jgi:hypothetical protein
LSLEALEAREVLSASITPSTVPAAPALTATAVSTSQINLSWKAVSGATGYLVDELINGRWVQIASLGSTSTTDSVTGLSAGTTYSFEVAAVNRSGRSWSPAHSVITFAAAPTLTATAVSTSQVNLSWNSVKGASGYLVDEWINGNWVQIASLGSTSTGYSVTGLSGGTTYYFDVASTNKSGTSWASWQSATTFQTAPAAPTLTATAYSSSEIDLSWNSVSGSSSYLVDEWINGNWVQIATLGSGSTFDAISGLNANTTYYFDVAASNSAGTTWASWKSATTGQVIDHPAANGTYSNVSGVLFGPNGPSYLDVQQGQVGDCWLMASLAEVAARDPQDITSMFTYQGTTVENGVTVGLYSVRFYDSNGYAHYVTVDTELPNGGYYYDTPVGGSGAVNGSSQPVLWVALAEKAYAEANGLGYVTTSNPGVDSYAALDGGWPQWALQVITGWSANRYSVNPTDVASAWNAGELIVLDTNTPTSSYIVGDHCYAVVGYNSASSLPYEAFNPWGTDANGWAPGCSGTIYGLFNCDGNFLSSNFDGETFGWGTAHGSASQAHGVQNQVAVDHSGGSVAANQGNPSLPGLWESVAEHPSFVHHNHGPEYTLLAS